MAKKTATSKKRNVKVDAIGQLHVHSSFNNIIVSLANSEGQVISWSSAGKMGFRGSKKNTPYAAQMSAEDCGKVAFDLGLRKVTDVSQLSVAYTAVALRWQKSLTLHRFHTTDAVLRSVVKSKFRLQTLHFMCLQLFKDTNNNKAYYLLWLDI